MEFGLIAFITVCVIALIEGIFKAIDKRTIVGRKVKWIFRIVAILILAFIIIFGYVL